MSGRQKFFTDKFMLTPKFAGTGSMEDLYEQIYYGVGPGDYQFKVYSF